MAVFIPTPLCLSACGQSAVEVYGSTIAEVLSQRTEAHPDLRKHRFSLEGKLRAFVNLYLNEVDVRYLPQNDATPVSATDTLSIIPSITGGTDRPGNCAFGSESIQENSSCKREDNADTD